MGADLGESQLYALQFTERFMSTLSLLGFFFIVYTYVFCKAFAKPINRLIFYAAWGNLGTVVAGLIANNGINAGQESALCQFQAFIIQMCVQDQPNVKSLPLYLMLTVWTGSKEPTSTGHCACR